MGTTRVHTILTVMLLPGAVRARFHGERLPSPHGVTLPTPVTTTRRAAGSALPKPADMRKN